MASDENSEETRLGRLVSERPEAVALRTGYAGLVARHDRPAAIAILAEGALFADAWGLIDVAAALAALQALPEAIPVYQQAARRLPDHPAAFAGLAHAWGALGEKAKAEAMAARARDLGWQEAFPSFEDAQTPAGTRHLFDQYAPRFDTHLVDTLGYGVPDRLAALIDGAAARLFDDALDIGCGTGLMGVRLRPRAKRLSGIDLSPGMLRVARDKALYDRLIEGDFVAWQAGSDETFDLIAAADVLPYVGDLDGFLARVAQALRPEGILAASLETHEGDGTILRPSRRYAHAVDRLHACARGHGLQAVGAEAVSPRRDAGEPVPGLNVVWRKA